MPHFDRLSSLIAHLEIRGERVADAGESNLAICGEARLVFLRDMGARDGIAPGAFLPVRIDLGGSVNPLLQALPAQLDADLTENVALAGIARLIREESAALRCGGDFALDKLCELLIVSLLRSHIEQAGAQTGVFAGLAHPKLSRVLVAMHDAPGRSWRVDDLVPLAGMSRSQFMAEFQAVVGETPIAYLKAWRMVLARGAILSGERINQVARRYGYQNSDAFSRAFVAAYGVAPTKLRKAA